MVQRRAARYCLHAYTKKESVTAMLQKLNWETLEQRRLKARVVMGYCIVNDPVMMPKDQLIPNTSSTRGHHMKFHKIYAQRNYYKNTFSPAFIPLRNALPTSAVLAATIDVCKDELAGEILMETILSQHTLLLTLTSYHYLSSFVFPPVCSFINILTRI